jgi:ubiquinone/menaquinone biosynthesis C-methylase UbiE
MRDGHNPPHMSGRGYPRAVALPRYSTEPDDNRAFSDRFDRLYSRFARLYDLAVKALPTWRRWLSHALPHIEGPRVLEVSPGTGWLLTKYARDVDAHAVDLNRDLVEITRRNLRRAGVAAEVRVGDVAELPYPDAGFDTVLSTMAFSGYPDGRRALSEMVRVLRPGGRMVIIDVNYPGDGNRLGCALVEMWKRSGDLIRDIASLLADFDLDATDREIGGFGSIHLYLATRPA